MININLIAERRNRRIREANTIRWGILGTLILAAMMVALVFISWLDMGFAQHRARVLDETKQQKTEAYERVVEVEAEIQRHKPRVTMLKQVRASEGAWMTILSDLAAHTPPDVYLESLTADAQEKEITLQISGMARDQHAVANFMTVLRERTKWALRPSLGPVTADKTGQSKTPGATARPGPRRVSFQIEVPIRGMMGGTL